jgi:polyribonucleotide nucleotidyltransferase
MESTADIHGQRLRRNARTDGRRRADEEHGAGISIGLVSEAGDDGQLKRYELLTDIIGSEDHYGDMDFKLCGTDAGVTGFQLDLKLPGIGHNIMAEAIQRAKETHEDS